MNHAPPLLLLILALVAPPAFAAPDEGDTTAVDEAVLDYEKRVSLPDVVVTPSRGPRQLFETPRQVISIPEEQIREQAPVQVVQTMTQRDAGVIMDIRTATTGDPIMRGFAGFNLLTLIDGNTLSTLWGEGGFGADDMYGKIDSDTVERIEIVHGPHSVLYGSNALGGVINVITRTAPFDYQEEGYRFGGRARATYYSNGDGLRTRLEAYGAGQDFRYLVGVTRMNIHDLEGGKGQGTLDPSGGKETNFDFRFDYRPLPGQELSLSILDARRTDQVRYYRPFQENTADRTGVGLTWKVDELVEGIENFSARIYYQRKKDQRRFNDTDRAGYALTETYSTDLQASTPLGGGHVITYGIHAHRDDGRAPDDEQFYYNRPHPSVSDSPDSRWANYGAYVQDEWEAVEDLLSFTAAIRYDYMVFHSYSTSAYMPPAGDPADDYYRDTTDAVTGGLGVNVQVEEHWRVLGSWSRGYRQYAPNFGIRQLGAGTLIPNELLDPVTSDNYEVGVRARYPTFTAENFFWYSKIKNWQEVGPATFNGSDWYDFNGNNEVDANENVVAYKSISSAYLYGVEGRATLFFSALSPDLPPGWSVWGGYAWNAGKDAEHAEMRHTMPLRGLVGIRWDDSDPERQAYVEGIVEMVNRYDRIHPSRLGDLAWRRDPQDKNSPLLREYGGVPGYTVISIYAGINLCSSARLRVGVENLTDQKYRRAHSRMDAPGIGFIAGLDVSF